MRILGFIILVSMFAHTLQGQIPDNSPEAAIRDALNQKSDFFGSGTMDKQLSRMGDAAAVATIKFLAGKALTAVEIDRILIIIRMAFSAPQIVDNESDREPRAALFILQSLEYQTFSARQKEAVSELKAKLIAQLRSKRAARSPTGSSAHFA